MISIIIPAHNEEKVIASTLTELVPGVVSGEIEVIIVCNGCTDNTVGLVKNFGTALRCIETTVPSKSNALNLGDMAASGFPRFYQDADVVLSLDTIRQVAQILETGMFLAAAPKMLMDFSASSWAVRAYYQVWKQLPYVREGMIGVGVYALSEKGRKRFLKFPQILADDGYIRALFKPHERTAVITCSSLVRAPATLHGLLKIKTRSRLGRYELEKKFPQLLQNEEKAYAKAFIVSVRKINHWPKLLLYIAINVMARCRANYYFLKYGFTGWERDDSSRNSI